MTGLVPAQGHDHTLTVPFSIGPMVLRVALLMGVLGVTAFAILRPFLPAPSRRANQAAAAVAAFVAILVLMLAGGMDIPARAVVLVLAGLAVPLLLFVSHDKRVHRALARAAPYILLVTAALALAKFADGWLTDRESNGMAVALYTAVVFALVGLSWFTICEPRSRPARVVVCSAAATLALATTAGTAHATVLRLPASDTAISAQEAGWPSAFPCFVGSGQKTNHTQVLAPSHPEENR